MSFLQLLPQRRVRRWIVLSKNHSSKFAVWVSVYVVSGRRFDGSRRKSLPCCPNNILFPGLGCWPLAVTPASAQPLRCSFCSSGLRLVIVAVSGARGLRPGWLCPYRLCLLARASFRTFHHSAILCALWVLPPLRYCLSVRMSVAPRPKGCLTTPYRLLGYA